MKTVLLVILGLVSLVMILAIMLQPSKSDGISSLSGGAAQLFGGKKKAKGYEKKLEKLTVILGIAFIVVILALIIMG